MNTNNIFQPRRIGYLLKEELFFGQRTTGIVTVAVLVILSIIAITWGNDDPEAPKFHEIWYPILLLAGGFLFTSQTYASLSNKPKKQFYLGLPASTLEKFTTKWIITAVLFPIALLILYQLFAWGIQAVISNISYLSFTLEAFDPFSEKNWLMIRLYLVLQTIFLCGAVVFQRYAIFKTIFALTIFGLASLAATLLVFRILFASAFTGLFTLEPSLMAPPSKNFQDWVEFSFTEIMKQVFFWITAPLFLVIGYFKLKEKEV